MVEFVQQLFHQRVEELVFVVLLRPKTPNPVVLGIFSASATAAFNGSRNVEATSESGGPSPHTLKEVWRLYVCFEHLDHLYGSRDIYVIFLQEVAHHRRIVEQVSEQGKAHHEVRVHEVDDRLGLLSSVRAHRVIDEELRSADDGFESLHDRISGSPLARPPGLAQAFEFLDLQGLTAFVSIVTIDLLLHLDELVVWHG